MADAGTRIETWSRWCVALALLLAPPLSAQAPTEILVLGMYHFANPGLDGVKTRVADVLEPARQAEVAAIVRGLARFRPTVIAVEQTATDSAWLDSAYAAYRAGQRRLTRNETEQIGFRLAAQFGHQRVYPVDVQGNFPFDAVMAYAATHDSAFTIWVQRTLDSITTEENRRQALPIARNLGLRNAPGDIARTRSFYLRIAAVGAGDTFVGAELTSQWYARNLRIFANMQRLATPGQRIVLLIGSGHIAILRELIAGDPRFRLVEPARYLPH